MSEELPIPPGWRLVFLGEPIPADYQYWSGKWNRPVGSLSSLIGEKYTSDWWPMITQDRAQHASACGVIDVGTDR